MARVINWANVVPNRWAYQYTDKNLSYLAYKLEMLPNFSSERFLYLGKEADARSAEVAKKQFQMLRGFHNLGENWGISMRLYKNEQLTLYLVFRHAGESVLTAEELRNADAVIQNALLKNEYTFQKIDYGEIEGIGWVTECAEILKEEKEESGAKYPSGVNLEPQQFYIPFSWMSADNNMEHICTSLMNYRGRAVVEITVVPTRYNPAEKAWVNINISRIKEAYSGETIKDPNGKVIWRGEPIPVLKTALDNCEKMDRQYEVSRLFLSSIRVFTEHEAAGLADAVMINSVKNAGNSLIFRSGMPQFRYLAYCYSAVDISADIHSSYWLYHNKTAPYRAQRLNRLVSLEEIANFFRIPIPTKPGFPGFRLDTGLRTVEKKQPIVKKIVLGNYMDEIGSQADAGFSVEQFAKHGLIVGVPGSGKTTAMFNILYQFWAMPKEQRIPFIILEPAKTEYRALKTLPLFREDMLIFTLGDETISPFRFNPMEVLPGIKLETHISKLQACFIGAFDLFDPLPYFLEQAIRKTYEEKGWYDDSIGGEEGLETPTLSDLCENVEYIISHSGFDQKMKSDLQASLLERLNSLRKGSKGRMLDTVHSIPVEDLMESPVVLELDNLNGNEKSLIMMFLLTYVYEYCKAFRKSGSKLKHMLLVEEAHNLIPASGGGSENRANPKAHTIELFTSMLAEMRALGQGILIADQLPTAIAPQAVKQTNVKVLMRVTAKDDREEIGNTMDLNEEQMHQVVNFKTGHAYLYHEGEDRVRMLRMINFKGEHQVEEPPEDRVLKEMMKDYEKSHMALYLPFEECSGFCKTCSRRVRNQAEQFVKNRILSADEDVYTMVFGKDASNYREKIHIVGIARKAAMNEAERLKARYGKIGEEFGFCVYTHMLHLAKKQVEAYDQKKLKNEEERRKQHQKWIGDYISITKGDSHTNV